MVRMSLGYSYTEFYFVLTVHSNLFVFSVPGFYLFSTVPDNPVSIYSLLFVNLSVIRFCFMTLFRVYWQINNIFIIVNRLLFIIVK